MLAGCSSARIARGALDEGPQQRRRALRRRVPRHRLERRHALTSGVGVVDRRPEPVAAEDEDEPVLPDRLDEQLDAVQADRSQLVHETPAHVGADPAGAPVGDRAVRPERAEVAADRDVVRAQIEVDPERLEHAAADAVPQRIVAEQAEVPRPAAGRDAGHHRDRQAAHVARRPGRRGSGSTPSPARSARPARSAGRPGRPRPGGRSSTGSRSRAA